MRREPVRWNVLVPAGLVAVSTLLGTLAVVDTITTKAVLGAVAAALTQFAVLAFGVQRARHHAWSPDSVERLTDHFVAGLEAAHAEET